jgi:hypothetical protein
MRGFALAVLLALPPSQELPELVREDFEKGSERWEYTDGTAWKLADGPTGRCLSQHGKSKYAPPHRSPLNIALLKDVSGRRRTTTPTRSSW